MHSGGGRSLPKKSVRNTGVSGRRGWGKAYSTDLEVFAAVRSALGVRVEPRDAQKRSGELGRIALDCTKAKAL